MNTNSEIKSEKSSSTSLTGLKPSEKEKMYSLQGFINKINKSDSNTFGNYFVDFNEMFPDNTEYVGYMKKKVSLFNNENVEKKSIKSINSNFFLKPTYFGKFSDETLFYIFYFMPKDTLQLLAAEELFKRKWRYNTDNTLWFSSDTNEEKGSESFMYFNPNEWKTMKYAYGPLNMKSFLTDEIFKYARQLNLDK